MVTKEVLLWALTLLNLAMTSFAAWAAITARSSLRELRRRLAERSTRSLRQLDAEVAAIASSVSSLSTTTRRISSRLGMQDVRARRREQTSSSLDPSKMSKSQLRLALQTGQLRAIRDGQGHPAAEDTNGATGHAE